MKKYNVYNNIVIAYVSQRCTELQYIPLFWQAVKTKSTGMSSQFYLKFQAHKGVHFRTFIIIQVLETMKICAKNVFETMTYSCSSTTLGVNIFIIAGGGVDSKLGVSGDSAGGRLAAVVCHEAHHVIDFAVCITEKQNNINANNLDYMIAWTSADDLKRPAYQQFAHALHLSDILFV